MEKYKRESFSKEFKHMLRIGRWGIECDTGWDYILYNLLSCIDSHTNNDREYAARTIRYNRAIDKFIRHGDASWLRCYYKHIENKKSVDTFVGHDIDRIAEHFASGADAHRNVVEAPSKIRVVQIKEKFGGLRFYYGGGDNKVEGMVGLAEQMSYTTCEKCGSHGKIRHGSWMKTLCDNCHNGDNK